MEHPDSDRLARAALDPGLVDADLSQHVDGCPACRSELADLHDLAELTRAVRSEHLEAPPPQVWQGVVDELGLRGRRARSTRPLVWAAVAAAVGLGIGSVTTWALVRPDDGGTVASEVVRTADLEPLPEGGATASGTARLLRSSDGAQQVEVSAPGLGAATGYFEVWLIRPDSTQMVSLGVLGAGDVGQFTVPASALEDGYTWVDVSDEPDDGLPTHSGASVLRGDLDG